MGEGRVLQVLGSSTGGMRRHVAALREGLVARGWEVVVAAPPGTLDQVDVALPVSLRPDRATRAWRGLREAVGHEVGGHDVVHAHGLKAGWLASVPRSGPPLVLTVHNRVLPGQGGVAAPLLRGLERLLPRRADLVVAPSVASGAEVAALVGREHVRVIPPVGPRPVPTRAPAEVRDELGVTDGQLIVGVGRLHRQKGWPVLVDAVAWLAPGWPDLRVVIAGRGPGEDELRRRIAAAGLGRVIRLLGARDDTADLLAAADVVAVPSAWESGPLVAAEAMALGRPVVATAVGFLPELVDGSDGALLIPVGDAGALATGLGDQLRDPAAAAAMGERGRTRVAERLDPDRLVDALVAVYDEVRRGGGR